MADDIAWGAGIIEGEGYMGLIPTKGHIRCRIQVDMTDKDIVYKLKDVFGVGNIYSRSGSKEHYKDIYRWSVQVREDVFGIIIKIIPYLGARRLSRAIEILAELAPKVLTNEGNIERLTGNRPNSSECSQGELFQAV